MSSHTHELPQETVKTHEIAGRMVDVVACRDSDTPEGEVEFYDLWLRGDDTGCLDTCLNEGDPWYPEDGVMPPTVEEIRRYLSDNDELGPDGLFI